MLNEIIVPVSLGSRSYDIIIGRGVLQKTSSLLSELKARRALIVTDDNIYHLYGETIKKSLLETDFSHIETHSVKPGENSKSYETLREVCEAALAAKLERKDLIIAFGGGVVGDLAGFAAAILRRGIRFVQIPTSLLAQVDSSVGGKTGINSPQGKNLIGAFHQPSLVLADTALVDTLPPRENRAGYAEIVKYGLINDVAFFDWCDNHWKGLLAGQSERDEAVAHSCRAKAAIVGRDEQEQGERALLNLGHTFGHALERISSYNPERLIHGEGVAIGTCLAFRFSAHLGLCPQQDALRVEKHMKKVGLPTHLQNIPQGFGSIDAILEAMTQDKKVENGQLTLILCHGIGQSYIEKAVTASSIKTFLEAEV